MHVAHKLADLIGGKTDDAKRWQFVDGPLPEAFAGIRDDGKVVISWRGENYTRMPVTLRVRFANWLNGIGNRAYERQHGLT